MSVLARLFLLSCILFSSLRAECPPHLSSDAWEILQPYLLPENHAAKKVLDQLFSSEKILNHAETLKKAKFKQVGQGHSKVKVLKHKKLKGYLIKAYTDDQAEVREWEIWMKRIGGAIATRQAIEMHQLSHFFTVPKKWIYQVKRNGVSPEEKNFVLLVEDMQIYGARSNFILWNGSSFITKEKLQALHLITQEAGLSDSLFIDNIPFTKEEKIAFVDTEYFHKWPLNEARLTSYLSKKMQKHWLSIISKN